MKQPLVAALVLTLLAGGAARAEAQVLGLPVNNSGIGTGVALYGDVGIPNDAAGGGIAAGATVRAGFSRIGVTGSAAYYNPGGSELLDVDDDLVSIGGTLNYRLLGGPLIPLSATLQAGAGYARIKRAAAPTADVDTVTQLRIPVGLGIAFSMPNPVLSIRPWIAPRVDIVRTTVNDLDPETNTAFAVSAGVELNLLTGLGLHATYDWSGEEGHPQTLGVGLHYGFRVPGL
jgi:opacity protein-like surface antigen